MSYQDQHGPDDEVQVDLGPVSYGNLSATVAGAPIGTASSGSGGHHRFLRRGERCGRCFRRRWVRMIFRLVNLAFAFVFLASAALQYNDSAGVLWAALYLTAAVFCVLSELSWRQLRTYFVLPTLWLFAVCTALGALYILIAEWLISGSPASSPQAYDFWGLAVVTFWMCIVLLLDRHNVVGVFRGYTSLGLEHERDKEGHVQMGEVIL